MRKLNIKCIKFTRKSRKFSTYKGTIGKVAKNLINRRFNTKIPLQKITTDTTEFKYYVLGSDGRINIIRSEEHTSELQSRGLIVCRLLLEKNNKVQLLNSTRLITKTPRTDDE